MRPHDERKPSIWRGGADIRRRVGGLVFAAICLAESLALAGDWHLSIKENGRLLQGDCIHWSSEEFILLARDGQAWDFDIARAPEALRRKGTVSPFTHAELRAQLLREFGSSYDVSGAGHYLVVHPAGQRNRWANRFDGLYREMVQYFTTRGIRTTQPDYPLVAVVFPTEAEFYRHAKDDGVTNGVLGYYSCKSNRVMLFDQSGGRPGVDWRITSATVVHEAAHQTAYNTGVHSRWVDTPRWISEGLGTLFEAPGVNSPSRYGNLADRINPRHFQGYRRYFGDGLPKGAVRKIVVSNDPFRREPLSSYALAWALTFMMAEQQPRDLAKYLQLTASKRGFLVPISPSERLRDFQAAFGSDFDMIQARLERTMNELN